MIYTKSDRFNFILSEARVCIIITTTHLLPFKSWFLSYFCDNIPDSAPRPGVDKARRIPEALIYWSLARFTAYLAQDQIESLSGPGPGVSVHCTVLICMSPRVQCPDPGTLTMSPCHQCPDNGLIALLPPVFLCPAQCPDHGHMAPMSPPWFSINISIF